MMTLQYRAKHPWQADEDKMQPGTFAVRQHMDGKWYAINGLCGCSQDYDTADAAVVGLLLENGFHSIEKVS